MHKTLNLLLSLYKREYNSERRRKPKNFESSINYTDLIRENITPRGDGNLWMSKDVFYLTTIK